ncbi:MAG: putative O-antigen polymerase [Planctomycetaceae bacterium]|nr:putative O-antigen polymerase [Planctomycetaceae bacterium]
MMPEMTSLEWCLVGYCLLNVLCVGAVSWKYRTLFHPLLFPGLQLFVMAGLAPIAQDIASVLTSSDDFWMQTSLLTSLYLIGLTWPLLTNLNPFLAATESLLGPLEFSRNPRIGSGPLQLGPKCNANALGKDPGCDQLSAQAFTIALAVCGVICFGLLIRESSAGSLWLTDPRTAYLDGRAAAGHWYVLSQTFLFLAYLNWLYFSRPRNRVLVLVGTFAAMVALLFFGSKAAMVGVVLAGGVYYNFFVRQFTWKEISLGLVAGIPLVVISPWLQGNFDSLTGTLRYYDYFNNASMYLCTSERFSPMYGGGFLSSLWEYVPRRFVPEKPYVYGNIIINEYFFPGAARTGYTPGWLPWISLHLDFGPLGVACGAVALGFLNKAIYTYFLKYRTFLGYLCFLQTAFIPVLKLAPVLYFVALLLGLVVTVRLLRRLIRILFVPN